MSPIRNPNPKPKRWKDDSAPAADVDTPSSKPSGLGQAFLNSIRKTRKPLTTHLKIYSGSSTPNSSPQAPTLPLDSATPSRKEVDSLCGNPTAETEHLAHRPTIQVRPGQLSFLISFVIHTAFLLLLAVSVFSGIKGTSHPILLNASVSETGGLGQGEALTSLTIEPPAINEQTDAKAHDHLLAQTLKNATGDSATQTLAEIAALSRLNHDDLLNSPNTQQLPSELAALADLANNGAGEDAGENGQVAGQATFFGSKAYGTKFVYIIDASTSMEGYRWNRAIGELLKSIGQLSDGTEYFVIAFHLEAVPIDLSRAATKTFLVKNKSSVVMSRRWLRQLQLAPQTMPATSLRLALDFKPDAIFMLSDGELRDNSLAMLRNVNQADDGTIFTPIHSIHLFSDDGRETLKALAEENGGTFTAVRAGK